MSTAVEEGPEMVQGTCSHCGDEGEIYADSGWCQQCDEDTVWCGVCNERMHTDDVCRHLYWDNDVCWTGPGGGYEGEESFRELLTSAMWKLAGSLGWRASGLLAKALRDHSYRFFYHAPMIGSGHHLDLMFPSIRDRRRRFCPEYELEHALQDVTSRAEYEGDMEPFLGVQLLFCLWAGHPHSNWDDCGLTKTPAWDVEYANALDAAFDSYGR